MLLITITWIYYFSIWTHVIKKTMIFYEQLRRCVLNLFPEMKRRSDIVISGAGDKLDNLHSRCVGRKNVNSLTYVKVPTKCATSSHDKVPQSSKKRIAVQRWAITCIYISEGWRWRDLLCLTKRVAWNFCIPLPLYRLFLSSSISRQNLC